MISLSIMSIVLNHISLCVGEVRHVQVCLKHERAKSHTDGKSDSPVSLQRDLDSLDNAD